MHTCTHIKLYTPTFTHTHFTLVHSFSSLSSISPKAHSFSPPIMYLISKFMAPGLMQKAHAITTKTLSAYNVGFLYTRMCYMYSVCFKKKKHTHYNVPRQHQIRLTTVYIAHNAQDLSIYFQVHVHSHNTYTHLLMDTCTHTHAHTHIHMHMQTRITCAHNTYTHAHTYNIHVLCTTHMRA